MLLTSCILQIWVLVSDSADLFLFCTRFCWSIKSRSTLNRQIRLRTYDNAIILYRCQLPVRSSARPKRRETHLNIVKNRKMKQNRVYFLLWRLSFETFAISSKLYSSSQTKSDLKLRGIWSENKEVFLYPFISNYTQCYLYDAHNICAPLTKSSRSWRFADFERPPFTPDSIYLLTHSLNQSINQSLTHSLTHSLTL